MTPRRKYHNLTVSVSILACCDLEKMEILPGGPCVPGEVSSSTQRQGTLDAKSATYTQTSNGLCRRVPKISERDYDLCHVCPSVPMVQIRLDYQLGSGPFSPDAPRPYFDGPFMPHIRSWEPWPPDLILIISGSKKGTQIYYFFLSRVPQTYPSRFASGDPMERNTHRVRATYCSTF